MKFARNEVNRSKRWRSNTANQHDKAWRRYVDLYHGLHYDYRSGTDQLTINMVFATINVMAPAVALQNPKFAVNAQSPDGAPGAVIVEEVLNYIWRSGKFQPEFRLAVLDWLIIGHGWCKVGYKFKKAAEAKKAPSVGESGDPEKSGETEGIDDNEDVPGNVESEMLSRQREGFDSPFIERVTPFDMFVDPDARHPKEMRWIAQRTWRAVADVQVDSRYSATQRKRVGGSAHSRWDSNEGDARVGSDRNRAASDSPEPGAVQYAEIIEFYDIRRNEVMTFAMDSSDDEESGFLIKPTEIPYALGHPFVMLRNYEVPDHFYPVGDVAQIESLQLELNETRNQMFNFRKKFRRAWVFARDMFDRDGIAALESEQDNVIIPMMGDGDPSKAIIPMPAAITPPEFFDQSSLISNDIDRVSGVSDYQRGAQTAIKRTATEAAMIQDASNARAQDRLQRIEFILSDIGERVVALLQQYMTGEKVARMTNLPAQAWVPYTWESIQGRFDYSVAAGSTEPQNETFRRQSALQLVDASMPFLEMGVANPVALYQHILSKGFGIQDITRFVKNPAPPPDIQQVGGPPQQQQPMPPQQPPAPMPAEMSPMGPAAQMGGMPQDISPELIEMMMAEGGAAPPMG